MFFTYQAQFIATRPAPFLHLQAKAWSFEMEDFDNQVISH